MTSRERWRRPLVVAAAVLAVGSGGVLASPVGADDAVARCLGRPATVTGSGTIVGTPGRDVIVGSPGPDVISGLAGDDIICGLGGNDVIDPGEGRDRVDGGPGLDTLDYADSASGVTVVLDDALAGVVGSVGARVLAVENIVGSDFDDVLVGNRTRNVIEAGDGDDIVVGLAGGDRLLGEGGDDRLIGDVGADQLVGGSGVDVCDAESGVDTATECVDPSRFLSSWSVSSLDVDTSDGRQLDSVASDGERLFVKRGSETSTAIDVFVLDQRARFVEVASMEIGEATYQIEVGDGILALTAPDAVIVFEETAPNEWAEVHRLPIESRSGGFLELAVDGRRVVVGDHRDSTDVVGGGAIQVIEESADGWSSTRLAPSTVEPYDQHGYGVDVDGDRIVSVSYNWDPEWFSPIGGTVIAFDLVDGAWVETEVFDLWSDEHGFVEVDANGDTILATLSSEDDFVSSVVGFILTDEGWLWDFSAGLDQEPSFFSGGLGYLLEFDGNIAAVAGGFLEDFDTDDSFARNAFYIHERNDDGTFDYQLHFPADNGFTRSLALGDDFVAHLVQFQGSDVRRLDIHLPAESSDLCATPTATGAGLIIGTGGDDVIVGSDGPDLILGLGGDDVLCAEGGVDVLLGGPGADVFDGGDARDTVRYDEATAGVRVSVGNGPGDGMIGEGDDVTGTIETVVGTPFADVMLGSSGNETFFGLDGNDRLRGFGGADRLFGGPGVDVLHGGSGDDHLDGGAAADRCRGGTGTDTAIWCESEIAIP